MGLGRRYQTYATETLGRRVRDIELYRAELERLVGEGDRVLHFGCGWDRSGIAAALCDRAHVVGVDADARVGPRYPADFWRVSPGRLPFATGSFDGICSEYVFEHIEHPEPVMAELGRVLRRGGWLAVLTPNRWSYKSLAATVTPLAFHRLVAATLRPDARVGGDVYPTHYRMNTDSALRRLAARHGFILTKLHYLNNGATWFRRLPGLFELGLAYHHAIDLEPLRKLRCGILATFRKRDTRRDVLPDHDPPRRRDPLGIRCIWCARDGMDRSSGGYRCPGCQGTYRRSGRVTETRP